MLPDASFLFMTLGVSRPGLLETRKEESWRALCCICNGVLMAAYSDLFAEILGARRDSNEMCAQWIREKAVTFIERALPHSESFHRRHVCALRTCFDDPPK